MQPSILPMYLFRKNKIKKFLVIPTFPFFHKKTAAAVPLC